MDRKGLIRLVLILGVMAAIFFMLPSFQGNTPPADFKPTTVDEVSQYNVPPKTVSQAELEKLAAEGKLLDARFADIPRGVSVRAVTADHTYVAAVIVPGSQEKIINDLRQHGTSFNYTPDIPSPFAQFLPLLFMMLILGIVCCCVMRMANPNKGGGAGGIGGITSSPAAQVETPSVRFADVGGVGPIIKDLDAVVNSFINMGQNGYLGAKPPRGFLMVGDPGVGKTLLAKAVCGEINARLAESGKARKPVPFLTTSGSEFVQMYVGVGAARVRSLFQQVRKLSPCILFIDEIDAFGSREEGAGSGGDSERSQTLNQLLVEMDGFTSGSKVLVLAATNRAENLDKALRRPGRFDRIIKIPMPNTKGREEILNIHAKRMREEAFQHRMVHLPSSFHVALKDFSIFAEDVNLEQVSRETPRMSGAQLYQVLIQAAELAERDYSEQVENGADKDVIRKGRITMQHIRTAIQKAKASMALATSNGGMKAQTQAPVADAEISELRLSEVGGIGHIRPQLYDAIERFQSMTEGGYLGEKPTRGIIFDGPPGTGKTLIAKAIAGEVNHNVMEKGGEPVRFLSTSASAFSGMFQGQGAERVNSLFALARESAPCIVFIDEIDALGKRDGNGGLGTSEDRRQTINQFLVQLDGFANNDRIMFIAATNRINDVDDALKRPGRFDHKITIPLPDVDGRKEILEIHVEKMTKAAKLQRQTSGDEALSANLENFKLLDDKVDLLQVARFTQGCSGADLANILNRAAEKAAYEAKQEARKTGSNTPLVNTRVTNDHITGAYQSLALGEENPRRMSLRDQFLISVHEIVGHALVGAHLFATRGATHADKVQTVTIVPRGPSLGAVWSMPADDSVLRSKLYYEGRICLGTAGRIAEDLFMGPHAITPGASSDIQNATQIATSMVTKWGMSPNLAFRDYKPQQGENPNATEVNKEIDTVLNAEYARAEAIILKYEPILKRLVRVMLVKKTLSGEEFHGLMDGQSVFADDELDLGENEAAFEALWAEFQAHRNARRAAIKAENAQLAAEIGL